ncbi:alpha/beta hydrolase family esterase [Seohaeicola nanhaiensis]|uniref:Alpha/beta hydrolase family esterase n=1 Tax=Seohaeicola nanhaiensis TaxID=1387282 RepID=A0ABV9KD81_9RHOB
MKHVIALLCSLAAGAAHAGCGDMAEACQLPDGEYHAVLPEAGGQGAPVVLWLHGAGSNGGNAIRNTDLIDALTARGYAVLTPTASRPFRDGGFSWNFFPGWTGRDETDFLKRAVADAAGRFGTDPQRVLLAGFSAGAFMVSYLACSAPQTFTAYAPVSGGFWRPMPERCNGPVRLFQTHGWEDTTVPLEGRVLRSGSFEQGDVFAGMELWRGANRCTGHAPTSYAETDSFWRRRWEDCATGSALEFALWQGGHSVPEGWADMVLDWFEALAVK